MVIVLATVFCMGGSTISMLAWLKIARLSPEQEAALDQSVRPIDRMPLLQHDATYLVPFFTKLHTTRKVAASTAFSFDDSITDDAIAATDGK